MLWNLKIKSRPIKLAFLIDVNDEKQVLKAINIANSLWWGQYFSIIQIYKKLPAIWNEKWFKKLTAKSVVLWYIKAYDPDILVKLTNSDLPEYVTKAWIRVISEDDIWKNNKESSIDMPNFGIGIYEILDGIYEKYFKFVMKDPYSIVVPSIPKENWLFWSSFLWSYDTETEENIKNYYNKDLDITFPLIETSSFKKLFSRNVLLPRGITTFWLDTEKRYLNRYYVFYLDINKPSDIIDFWNLRALNNAIVLPFPKQFLMDKDYLGFVLDFIVKAYRENIHNNWFFDIATVLIARWTSSEEIKSLEDLLKDSLKDKKVEYIYQYWYPRIWDDWAKNSDNAEQIKFYGSETSKEIKDSEHELIEVPTVIPDFISDYFSYFEPRVANDIEFNLYWTREFIAETFSNFSWENYLKALSWQEYWRSKWNINGNCLTQLISTAFNSKRRPPLAEEIFFSYLRDEGWNVNLSSSWLIWKEILKRLNWYIWLIDDEKILEQLNKMGSWTDATSFNWIIWKIRGWENILRQFRDLWIYKLWLTIQCPTCQRRGWYDLEKVTESIECYHCLWAFKALWNIEKSKPKWSYKTIGPFAIDRFADGSYSVLLTAKVLREDFLWLSVTPALSFEAKRWDEELEADLGWFWSQNLYGDFDSWLFFAECKSYNKFQVKDFQRMKKIAKQFPKAVLIFSTFRKNFTKTEIREMKKIANKWRDNWKNELPNNPVLILTWNELFSESWISWAETDDTLKWLTKKGLYGVCEITQKLYLWIDPWSSERFKLMRMQK